MAQRVLHKAEGELGNHHDERELKDDLARTGRALVAGVHEQHERIVPQVDAVGARAQPHERLGGEDAAERGAGQGDGRDDRCRGDRGEHQAAAVPEGVRARNEHAHEGEHAQAHKAHGRELLALLVGHLLGVDLGALGVHGPDKRQPCADEQRERARVGAVVHAARVARGVVHHDHAERRGAGQNQAETADAAVVDAGTVEPQHDERPDEIELLLDGERPEVQNRAGLRDGLEVRLLAEDIPPVGEPEQRGEQVGLELVEQALVQEERGERGHDDHERDGGEQAPHTADPEALKVDPVRLGKLDAQDSGDQEARDDKEHRHAHQAAGGPGQVEMVGEHGDDGQCAQAVDARQIAALDLAAARFRMRCGGDRPAERGVCHGLGCRRLF